MARFSLVPKNTKFDNLLIAAGDIAAQTASALQRMLSGYPQTTGMVQEIKALEHQGDRIMREMVSELLATFVTPYDREDIYELAKAIDDVIDHIDECASMFDIYQVESVTGCVKGQADILVAATQELAAALRHIEEPSSMEHHWSTIHKLEDAGDELLRTGIKEVFAACYDEPAIIICWKDIYTQLEEAIDACERAATVLEGVGVKKFLMEILLVLVVVVALTFDFTNGFHDTANSIATLVGTRAMNPQYAVAMAAFLNFVGAFLSIEVAATVGKDVVNLGTGAGALEVVLAGLVGAIVWNVTTWYYGLPSSSSHALIGGLVGASLAYGGTSTVNWAGVTEKVLIPSVVAPTLGLLGGLGLMWLLMRLVRNIDPRKGNLFFRRAQILTGGWLSLTHGMNDAQKTMGIIALALVTTGHLSPDFTDLPAWVKFSAATAMGLGTYAGGWKIIKTLGGKVVKMSPLQGFAASSAAATILQGAAHFGFPVSTTHCVSGCVMGAGASKRLSAVRWTVAGDIVSAWVMTLPSAAVVGAVAYAITAIHPALLMAVALGMLGWMRLRMAQGAVATAH